MNEQATKDHRLEVEPRGNVLRDLLGAGGVALLPLWLPSILRLPRGNGSTVVVLPGFLASDLSTTVLRRFLRTLGYRAVGWGLGRNTGKVPELQAAMLKVLPAFVERNGSPVDLVGWSLGGYIAREVARDRPESVRQVVTLGSPVVGGPKYTRAASYYQNQGVDLDALEDEIAARDEVPLQVPVTALYSRSDAIVAWEACIDRVNDGVEHQEVKTTHVGLGFHPEVLCRIVRALAA